MWRLKAPWFSDPCIRRTECGLKPSLSPPIRRRLGQLYLQLIRPQPGYHPSEISHEYPTQALLQLETNFLTSDSAVRFQCGIQLAARSRLFQPVGPASGPISAAQRQPSQRHGGGADRDPRLLELTPSILVRSWRLMTERYGRGHLTVNFLEAETR